VHLNNTVDPEPPPQPMGAMGDAPRTIPENEQTLDAPVATVGGSVSQPDAVQAATATDPLSAQPVTTELLITSEPAGARVTVDGIGWGSTPVTVRHLSPGTRHIRVTKDGYQGEERAAHVAGGSRNVLHIPMQAVQ
jgi:hypothetical protein